MTRRRRQARTQAVELVVQSLLGDLPLLDQSRSSVLNRRDPNCAQAAEVSDGAKTLTAPGKRRFSSPIQARCNPPSRLNREHRRTAARMPAHQPVQLLQARTEHRQGQRVDDQPRLVRTNPHPVLNLARINRHHQRRNRQRLLQRPTPRPTSQTRRQRLDDIAPPGGSPPIS